jgi:hypothetical protein
MINLFETTDKEKILQKHPFDPMFRSSFFSMSKYYRKEMKIREFRQNLVNQLDQLRDENPSQYWALLNELSNAYTKNETSEVPTNAWVKTTCFIIFQETNSLFYFCFSNKVIQLCKCFSVFYIYKFLLYIFTLSKLKSLLTDKEKILQKHPFDPMFRSSFFSMSKY